MFIRFFPLDSRVSGYYDLKHVEIGCILGLEFVLFISEHFQDAGWLRHILVHSATAMALDKNPAISPSSSVLCGQHDTMVVTIGCV